MNPDNLRTPPSVIRITRDEAMSPQVDDLLQRQKSLLGEAQSRSRGRRWYYQNWFVFMVAAGLAALAATAMLEPFFDDLQYLQGPIQGVSPLAGPGRVEAGGDQALEAALGTQGSVQIKGEVIWMLDAAKQILPDGETTPLDVNDLAIGQEVGVYVEYQPIGQEAIVVGVYVDADPPPQSPDRAKLTLRQLYSRTAAAALLLFGVVGGLIGLAVGAADGLICRLFRRALVAGGIGCLVGFVGGFVSGIVANLVYAPINQLAMEQSTGLNDLTPFGFGLQMVGRGFAWMLAGMTMGLGQGIAMRSKRLVIYGLLGGIIGGLLGGLLFDPIDLLLLGGDKPSSHWSRLIGFTVVGLSVGAMIGVVELLARDAWLRMLMGPLAGKEFLIFKDIINVGSSPRSDIYLFNDDKVAGLHATIRTTGDHCEMENLSNDHPAEVNGRRFKHTRLRHGDQIQIGGTLFVFQQRQS